MDVRLEKIANMLQKLDGSNPLNNYEIGKNFVVYFHTHSNKDVKDVVGFVEGITEPYLNEITMATSNKELYDRIKQGIATRDNDKSGISIDDSVRDVRLVDSVWSTRKNTVDVIYGDIHWGMLENGQTVIAIEDDVRE